MPRTFLIIVMMILPFSFFLYPKIGQASDPETCTIEEKEEEITIKFEDISMFELLRFISKIAKVNFVYDESLTDFRTSLMISNPTTIEGILQIITRILKKNGIKTEEHGSYFSLEKREDGEVDEYPPRISRTEYTSKKDEVQGSVQGSYDHYRPPPFPFIPNRLAQQSGFETYKLKYQQGDELRDIIKNISKSFDQGDLEFSELTRSISSMQWIKSTNSFVYTGSQYGKEALDKLIKDLDVPQKQIFIEVLVIETGAKNLLDFGLEWGLKGKHRDQVSFDMGNFQNSRPSPLGEAFKSLGEKIGPSGGAQHIPLGSGFNLGVIGDIIFHKGLSYLSLGSLISALETEGNSTIILKQKIIAQDNKLSHIFVGDNLPFKGSTVVNRGSHTVENMNIEYRDVGVTLDIKPMLGEGEMITLDLTQEITEALGSTDNSGIHTTKTNMQTQAHVPDKSFLVLSGVVRSKKRKNRSGIPCLGGLPLVGALFSKNENRNETRSVLIFVRPQIISGIDEHQTITAFQEEEFRQQTQDKELFEKGISHLKEQGDFDESNSQNSTNSSKDTRATKT